MPSTRVGSTRNAKRKAGSTSTRPTKRQQRTISQLPSKASSPILKLPKELLIRILSHYFGDPAGLLMHPPWSAETKCILPGVVKLRHERYAGNPIPCRPSRPIIRDTSLQALLVCREFYYAGIEAYFGERTFYFWDVAHIKALTRSLGADRKRFIKHIVVRMEFTFNEHFRRKDYQGRPMRAWHGQPVKPDHRPDLYLELPNIPLVLPRSARDVRMDPLVGFPSLRSVKVVASGNQVVQGLESLYRARVMGDIGRIIKAAWSSSPNTVEVDWYGDKENTWWRSHLKAAYEDSARMCVIAPT